MHLVGAFPASIDSWIPALLGRPVTVVRHGSRPEGFLEALRATTGKHRGGQAVIAVDAPVLGPTGRSGAVSIALRVDNGRGIELRPSTGRRSVLPEAAPMPGLGAPLLSGLAFALHAHFGPFGSPEPGPSAVEVGGREGLEFRTTGPTSWVGDWTGSSLPSQPIDMARPTTAVTSHLFAVSEGAYVPRPRYLENLPSRWRFVAERCRVCDTTTFPVRGRCRSCLRSDTLDRIQLPLHGGTVLASTVIAPGGQPTEFDDQVATNGPYAVVLVELAPGAHLSVPSRLPTLICLPCLSDEVGDYPYDQGGQAGAQLGHTDEREDYPPLCQQLIHHWTSPPA